MRNSKSHSAYFTVQQIPTGIQSLHLINEVGILRIESRKCRCPLRIPNTQCHVVEQLDYRIDIESHWLIHLYNRGTL